MLTRAVPCKLKGLPDRTGRPTVYMVQIDGRWRRVLEDCDTSTYVMVRGERVGIHAGLPAPGEAGAPV
jgi:hypothetical protein